MKILVIQQKRIGDVLVSSTLCNNLRTYLPEAEIHYLIFSFTKEVIIGNPNIDEILLFEDSDRTLINITKFALRIRRNAYDVVIDPYTKPESRFFTLMSGAKTRISFRSRAGIYNVTVPYKDYPPDTYGTVLTDRLNLLRPILGGGVYLDPQHRIFLSREEIEHGKRLLEAQGVDTQKPIAVFGIFGSVSDKTYPEDYMLALVEWFQDHFDAQIMLNYFPEQSADAKRFYQSMKNQENVFPDLGSHSLRNLAAILSFATLYAGNDSGHVHIAKSMNVPTFTIFAPFITSHPWGILGQLDAHDSAHITDLLPNETKNLNARQIRNDSARLYRMMCPELVVQKMEGWLRLLEIA
ncbi:MAG: glycosyltransferase family 9 protein [Planctomycetota bacterium]|jgi:heptosyltransferase-2